MRQRSSRPFFSRNWKLAVHNGVSFRSGATSIDIQDKFPNMYGSVYLEDTGSVSGASYRRVMGQKVILEDNRLEVGQTYNILVYPKLSEEFGGWKDKPYFREAKLLHIFERRSPLEKYLQADKLVPWLQVQEIREGFVQILHFERLIVTVWYRESNWVRFDWYSAKAKRLFKKIETAQIA